MAYATADTRSKWQGALAAGAIQVVLAIVIVRGLAAHYLGTEEATDTTLVALSERERKPEPPPSPPPPDEKDAGEGAPPALKAEPRPQEAPKPKLVIASPTPAPTVAGTGTALSKGLASVPGPGSGAGGVGNGTGTGTGGTGSGSGTGARTAPVRIAGGISDRDYPRGAAERGAAGTVAISFRVRSDGRVDGCRVIGSSGDGQLDGLTCSLVERRFSYRPARDGAGRPVDSTLRTTFTWGTRGRY
jgi:periplasmic protein TonB